MDLVPRYRRNGRLHKQTDHAQRESTAVISQSRTYSKHRKKPDISGLYFINNNLVIKKSPQ